MTSLNLDTRVDFEEGDIGLAGGCWGKGEEKQRRVLRKISSQQSVWFHFFADLWGMFQFA